MNYTIDFDTEELKKAYSSTISNFSTFSKNFLLRLTLIGQQEARSKSPRKTSNLMASIQVKANSEQGEVFTKTKYASFLEFGTGIYGARGAPILPRKAKVLAFKIDGRLVFRKSTKGVKPYNYFKAGKEKIAEQIPAELVQLSKQIAKSLQF
jgi:hypothetical protein